MIVVAFTYPESIWPDALWRFGADLMFLTGVVAAIIFAVTKGPYTLIKYGPNWMTKTGNWLLRMTGRGDNGQVAESSTESNHTNGTPSVYTQVESSEDSERDSGVSEL